jgi:hypothetical protein
MEVEEMALLLGVNAEHTHHPSIRFAQTFQTLDGRGFSGAIRSNHAENFTFLHIEINLIYCDCRTVGLT